MKRRAIFLLCIFLFSSLLANDTLLLGSGSKGKGYYALAHSIQKVLKENNCTTEIRVKETSGSADNLMRLQNGEIDMAIVQNDTAFFAENGMFLFHDKPVENIETVISFYKEPIFIITNQKNINNIYQLSNQRINIGLRRSGLQASAKVLLKSTRVWESINPYYRDADKSIQLLLYNTVQAIFLNYIDENIRKKIEKKELFIVPISERLIKKLNKTFSYFSAYEYQVDNFEKITTLSVTSILVADKEVDPKTIYTIAQILNEYYALLVFPVGFEKLDKHFIANPLKQWHSGVLDYFQKNHMNLTDSDEIDIYVLYMILAVLIMIVLLTTISLFLLYHADVFHRFSGSHMIIDMLQRLYLSISRHKYLFLGVVLVMAYLMCVLLIKYFEHKWAISNNILSTFDELSLYKNLSWLFVFGSSGYNGNLFPSSEEGKLVVSLVPLLGIGGIFAFVGLITFDQFKKYFLEVNGMGVRRVKDHIILCGWNDNAHFIVENLLHKNISSKRQIVILADMAYEEPIGKYKFDPMYVSYIKGQAISRDDLMRANIIEADIAIVISDSNMSDPDARTILKILTVERFCLELEEDGKRTGRANIHTIAEIADPQNIRIAEDAGVDQIISLGNIESKIFTQAVQNPGVAKFINEIMTYNEQNDIYSFPITEESQLFGKTYDEILYMLRKFNILLLSINVENRKIKKEVEEVMQKYQLENPVITNPFREGERQYPTHEGDLIIVLAQYEESVTKALKSLKKER